LNTLKKKKYTEKMATDSRKVGLFDRELRKMLELSKKIIEEKYRGVAQSNKDKQVFRSLQRYFALYSGTKPEQHIKCFLKFFERNRVNVLNILNDDKWLKEGDYVVQYMVEDSTADPELIKRAQKRKIPLSFIYNAACQIRERMNKSLKGLPLKEEQVHVELVWPDLMLLHLYRVMRECIDDPLDRSEVSRIVGVLEVELGDQTEESKTTSEGLIPSLAKTIMDSMNLNMSELSTNLPNEKDMLKTLEGVFGKNDLTMNLASQIGDIFKSGSITEGVTKAVSKIQDPTFINTVNEMVMKTIPPETMNALTKSVENVSSPSSDDISNVLNTLKNSNSPLGALITDEKMSQISQILPQMTTALSSLNLQQLTGKNESKEDSTLVEEK
jgi:hypothetical protein